MRNNGGPGLFTKIFSIAAIIFLIAPLLVIVLASFSPTALVTFPPRGFSLAWYRNIISSSGNFISGLADSLEVGIAATAIDMLIAVPAALAVTRYRVKLQKPLVVFFASPMYIPSITFALVLLQLFAMMGRVPAIIRIFVGHLIIIMPYIFRNTYSMLTTYDWTLEEAAASLGASPHRTTFDITLPLIKSGIVSGAILSFLYSFDEAVLASMLNSPKFITLPVRIMNYMEFAFDPTLAAISTLLILFSLVIVAIIEKVVGLNMFLK
ncbi:MAG: ABC transporter permease [Spirochaetia bacterium]|nr:ABC transporter permease [Spirochaetia bacterium]